MTDNRDMNIVVLSGGTSNERAISIRSGKAVTAALNELGHTAIYKDISEPNFSISKAVEGADLVIPMLHGAGGEDGSLQIELEALGVRYFGSEPKACADSFNKAICKKRLTEQGVLTPTWQVVNEDSFLKTSLRESKYVLKPIEGGSSIDMLIIRSQDDQPKPEVTQQLFQKYDKLLIEELINGREVTVAVLGDEALPVIEIIAPSGEEFDYANKYNGKTQEIPNPLTISGAVQKKLQSHALKVHNLIGCKGVTRTDMIIAEDGSIYVLEINTIPGMTNQSLVPKAAIANGMSMTELVSRMVELGLSE